MLDVLAGLADLEVLTTADDRGHAILDGLLGLDVDQLVGLVVVLATLGVTNDDVGAAQLRQHGAGHLTGVGAVVVSGDVLGAIGDRQLVTIDNGGHGADVGERRDDDGLGLGGVVSGSLEGLTEILDEGGGGNVVEIHLPVAGHDRGTRHQLFSLRTAIPGSSLPSMSSREAPPPVEM